MMDFLGNVCEAVFVVVCAVGLLDIAQRLRRRINLNDYDDTE